MIARPDQRKASGKNLTLSPAPWGRRVDSGPSPPPRPTTGLRRKRPPWARSLARFDKSFRSSRHGGRPVVPVSGAPPGQMTKVTLNGKESEITVALRTPPVAFEPGKPSLSLSSPAGPVC